MQDILERARQVRLVIFDVDGVLTDGGLLFDHNGEEHKIFHSRDGHGMKMLRECGIELAIITGRVSAAVSHRMQGLGVEHVYQGQQDKLSAFRELLKKLDLQPHQVAYVGDDVVDLPVMRQVGFAVAVNDAHELVKRHSHWQTAHGGGRGAARDVCELVLEAQGYLQRLMDGYCGYGEDA